MHMQTAINIESKRLSSHLSDAGSDSFALLNTTDFRLKECKEMHIQYLYLTLSAPSLLPTTNALSL